MKTHFTKRSQLPKKGKTFVKDIRSVPATENGAILNLRSLSRVTKNNSALLTPMLVASGN
ncbi:MAG: hypothetical protein WBX81_06170 [Nitrososphaeraceae archaeon]